MLRKSINLFQNNADLMQIAFVVPDVRKAILHWNSIGVGPFLLLPHLELEQVIHQGHKTNPDISLAIAYQGNMQIELIQQHNSADSIYSDFLKFYPEGGMQHSAIVSDQYGKLLSALKDNDIDIVQSVKTIDGSNACYIASDFHPGGMIEIIENTKPMALLFDDLKKCAKSWQIGDDNLNFEGA